MASRDAKYFNCSEKHEVDYVANKYEDKEAVKAFIKEKCADKTIHYSTHDEVYDLLEKNGFKKKAK